MRLLNNDVNSSEFLDSQNSDSQISLQDKNVASIVKIKRLIIETDNEDQFSNKHSQIKSQFVDSQKDFLNNNFDSSRFQTIKNSKSYSTLGNFVFEGRHLTFSIVLSSINRTVNIFF